MPRVSHLCGISSCDSKYGKVYVGTLASIISEKEVSQTPYLCFSCFYCGQGYRKFMAGVYNCAEIHPPVSVAGSAGWIITFLTEEGCGFVVVGFTTYSRKMYHETLYGAASCQ